MAAPGRSRLKKLDRKALAIIALAVATFLAGLLLIGAVSDALGEQSLIVQAMYYQAVLILITSAFAAFASKDVKEAVYAVILGLLVIWALELITAAFLPNPAVTLGGSDFGTLNTADPGFHGTVQWSLAAFWHWVGVPEGWLLVIMTYPVMIIIFMYAAWKIWGSRGFVGLFSRGR